MIIDDMLPITTNTASASGNPLKQISKRLSNFHFKEKSVSKDISLFVGLFIRLMSNKAKPFIKVGGEIHDLDQVINFPTFQYSYREYEHYVDKFIKRHKQEIQTRLEKCVNNVWKHLERKSIYVSTIVNNFDAFIKRPKEMSRVECLMKVCEFTNSHIGLVYSYIYSHGHDNDTYFENQLQLFYPKCKLQDLDRFKHLFVKFINCCTFQTVDQQQLTSYNEEKFRVMLDQYHNLITSTYSKFVSTLISKSSTARKMFVSLMSKVLRLYIKKGVADFRELWSYGKVIDIPKWIQYNSDQTVQKSQFVEANDICCQRKEI